MRLRAAIPVLSLLFACGGRQTGASEAREAAEPLASDDALRAEDSPERREDDSAAPEHAADSPAPVTAEPQGERPPPGSLAELFSFGFEARERDEPMPNPREAVADCAPYRGQGPPGPEWFQECWLHEMLARTPRGWLALAIDWEEGGVGEVHLIEGDASGRTERIGGELTPQRLEALRTALNGTDAQPLDDLIGRVVPMDFSLGTFHPLAELADSEWLLWVETTQDLDDPEWVLWLVSADGETKHEVARRQAELGPCDGGGYWCERTQAPCDAAAMRAEGRLCVLPLGLRRVAIHGDEMALIGSVMIPGHGGMPQLTWFTTLPER